MKILISSLALAALVSPLGSSLAQEPDSPILKAHAQSLEQAELTYQEQVQKLQVLYVNHLDKLAVSAQQDGDLKSWIVLKEEQKSTQENGRPPEEAADPAVEKARKVFLDQSAKLETDLANKRSELEKNLLSNLEAEVQRLTRSGEIDQAQVLQDYRKKLLAAQPKPEEPKKKAEVRLGPNLLAQGSIDGADDKWRIGAPRGRNKTGVYQEPNSGMNMTLRFEQTERAALGSHTGIRLKPGKTYQVSWRVRLLRPWKAGIELRGKGNYRMGFRIPGNIWRGFTDAQRAKHRHASGFSRQPPPDREWREYKHNIKAYNLQSEFYVNASRGEGDFLVDDIQVREILPAEEKKN